jgi:hypothetical protein
MPFRAGICYRPQGPTCAIFYSINLAEGPAISDRTLFVTTAGLSDFYGSPQ